MYYWNFKIVRGSYQNFSYLVYAEKDLGLIQDLHKNKQLSRRCLICPSRSDEQS